jgi:hypothetical protein
MTPLLPYENAPGPEKPTGARVQDSNKSTTSTSTGEPSTTCGLSLKPPVRHNAQSGASKVLSVIIGVGEAGTTDAEVEAAAGLRRPTRRAASCWRAKGAGGGS